MSVIVAYSAVIGPVALDVILTEKHKTSLEITHNPIELGADVNDHAIIQPKVVTLDIASSLGALTFIALVRFQETRVPFTLVTGLDVYQDMLIESIDADRDKDQSRILRATVTCKQVLIVSTGTAAATAGSKSVSNPGTAGGTNSRTSATPSKELASSKAGSAATTAAPTATIADRVAAPVQRGDGANSAVPSSSGKSILKAAFG